MATQDYYGGAAQDQLDQLLAYINRPDFYESDQTAAENAARSGGQGFSGARQGLLRRSQLLQNIQLAAPILENQAVRAATHANQTQSEAAQMARLQAENDATMQRLRVSEQGQGERLTQQETFAARQSILDNQAKIQQIQTQNRSQETIAGMNNAAANYRNNQSIQASYAINSANNATARYNTAAAQAGGITRTQLSNPSHDQAQSDAILSKILQATASPGSTLLPSQTQTFGTGIIGGSGDPGNELQNTTTSTPQGSYYFGPGNYDQAVAGGSETDDLLDDEGWWAMTGNEG